MHIIDVHNINVYANYSRLLVVDLFSLPISVVYTKELSIDNTIDLK